MIYAIAWYNERSIGESAMTVDELFDDLCKGMSDDEMKEFNDGYQEAKRDIASGKLKIDIKPIGHLLMGSDIKPGV